MAIQTSIPRLIDGPTMRVAVKVEKRLYDSAKKLKIDVHSLFRMTLQNAVDAIRRDEYEYNDPSSDNDTSQTFLDAMACVPHERDHGDRTGLDGEISERIKDAAQRAQGPFPSPEHRKR